MTVRLDGERTIVLAGECPVEDAEPLLQLLAESAARQIDWQACGKLHTAVLQVILAARPPVIGPCGDPWVEHWLAPGLGAPPS